MIVIPKFCPACGLTLEKRRVQMETRLACPACFFIHYDNPAPCAGVIIVNERDQVLLGRRRGNPFRGWWGIIGGFVEGAEHPEETARRECAEEAGVEVALEGLHGIWMDRYGSTPEHTLNIMYLGRIVSGEPVAGDDVVEVRWFDREKIPMNRVAFKNGRAALVAWINAPRLAP